MVVDNLQNNTNHVLGHLVVSGLRSRWNNLPQNRLGAEYVRCLPIISEDSPYVTFRIWFKLFVDDEYVDVYFVTLTLADSPGVKGTDRLIEAKLDILAKAVRDEYIRKLDTNE